MGVKFARFLVNGEAHEGLVEGKEVWEILSSGGRDFGRARKTSRHFLIEKVKLLAPCVPTKIVAIGLNYADHAREMKIKVPPVPILFLKPPSSVVGPEETILYPRMSHRVDYEAELACVIKKRARDVDSAHARDFILGYTCFNDVTARDLQQSDGQWTRSKSFDTFSPIGPWIVDDVKPDNLSIELYHNGVRKQASNTGNLIFKVEELVSFISRIMTLEPGDIITTGTPWGIGPLSVGDRVEVRIEGIGYLRNYVRSES